MITSKQASSLLLVGALVVSSTGLQAACPLRKIEMPSRTTLAIAAAFAAFGTLYTRKSEKNFTPRYSTDTLKDVKNIASKEYFQNLWFFFYDGFIGQRKQSSTLKAKEDGKVYASEDTPAAGVLGTVDSYAAPVIDGAKTYLFAIGVTFAVYSGELMRVIKALATKGESELRQQPHQPHLTRAEVQAIVEEALQAQAEAQVEQTV